MARPAAFVREWDHHEDREGHEGLPDASGHGEWVPGEGISGRVERANPKTRTRFKLRTGNPWRVVYVYPRLCDDFVDVMNPKSIQDIEARMQYLLEAPKDRGTLKMIVIRPSSNERREVASCRVSLKGGADGDHWAQGCWKSLPDGSPDPDVQLTLMNYRMLEVLSEDASRRSLAGDNLCVDLDLSADNLKAGDRLAIGGSVNRLQFGGGSKIEHFGRLVYANRLGPERRNDHRARYGAGMNRPVGAKHSRRVERPDQPHANLLSRPPVRSRACQNPGSENVQTREAQRCHVFLQLALHAGVEHARTR
jgi:hypothetical protein